MCSQENRNMRVLLSLPPKLSQDFHQIEYKSKEDYFCAHDPIGAKLGSAGATVHILESAWRDSDGSKGLQDWLSEQNRIIIHAGGQSRRLPAYAPSGKILTPMPLLSWARGQKYGQHLLDLQLPLLEALLKKAPPKLNTLIACGDALIRNSGKLPHLPEADVLCLGLWAKPEVASRHGVFFMPRSSPNEWAFSLQKPSQKELLDLAQEYHYLIDLGIWLLSDKAVKLLFKKCGWQENQQSFEHTHPNYYDLYGEFGLYLGNEPRIKDPEIQELSCAVVRLSEGEFYHFGRTDELIHSSIALRNLYPLPEKEKIKSIKNPQVFTQNSQIDIPLNSFQDNIWIENSHVSEGWKLGRRHMITGVPENDWKLNFQDDICLDIVPVGERLYCLRPYDFSDLFKEKIAEASWMGNTIWEWMEKREIDKRLLNWELEQDIQKTAIFPLLEEDELEEGFIQWMIDPQPISNETYKSLWLRERLSAEDLSNQANLKRLYEQRDQFKKVNLGQLLEKTSIRWISRLDLSSLAAEYWRLGVVPDGTDALPKKAGMDKIHTAMFMYEYLRDKDQEEAKQWEQEAFGALRALITGKPKKNRQNPKQRLLEDQLIIARAPLRMDLAGGWSDTPPYCLNYGGQVLNVAININGQPPIEVIIRSSEKLHFKLNSIDQGLHETVNSFEELRKYDQLGETFAIPKAALALAGFLPEYAKHPEENLEAQILRAGRGLEINLLAAVPKGSGLGTSSILATAVLGAISEAYKLGWSRMEIGHKVLVLEQMLTSGGGWQDQYGGLFPGLKYLETKAGKDQVPEIHYIEESKLEELEYKDRLLLYYTGITRIAHNILGEIVRGMFLNSEEHLQHLHRIYQHGKETYELANHGSYERFAKMVAKSWELNKALDSGTNPPQVEQIMQQIDPFIYGAKLLGAGGGGFLFIMAKGKEEAAKIKKELNHSPPNKQARFVEFSVSKEGLQIIRT
ncbi:MAG: bifunctional fucokinase/fucose-1-phosphate guanylyltransferase [Bacteroidota bacterium]